MPNNDPHNKYKEAANQNFDEELADSTSEVDDFDLGGVELAPLPENLNELCFEHVCPTCPQKEEVDALRLRALAEMDNYKKRLAREHEEQLSYAAERVLADLLPTLDNLDLALQYGSNAEACKDVLMGVDMTRKLLLEAVKNHGLEPVGVVGEEFTPELHEGLSFEVRDDMDEGLVSSVMQLGYKLKGRLLRPAKVCISKKS